MRAGGGHADTRIRSDAGNTLRNWHDSHMEIPTRRRHSSAIRKVQSIGRRRLGAACGIAAVGLILLSAWLSFQAGCTGDPKSGLGDPMAALKLENESSAALLVGWSIGSLAYELLSKQSRRHRRIALLIAAPTCLIVGWIVTWQLEVYGMTRCL